MEETIGGLDAAGLKNIMVDIPGGIMEISCYIIFLLFFSFFPVHILLFWKAYYITKAELINASLTLTSSSPTDLKSRLPFIVCYEASYLY